MKLTFGEITADYVIDAFYLADRQDEYIVDDIISIGTLPLNIGTIPASHEERMVQVDGVWWSFSSTSRKELGGNTGTRWIKTSELLRNMDRWVLVKSPVMPKESIREEVRRANGLIGMSYDFIGVVLDFIRPAWFFNNRKKIYCSKSCNYMQTGKMKRISPRRRAKLLKRLGYKRVVMV